MATGYDDDVEMRATWAQLAGNNRGKGSSLSNFMLQRMMLGNRTPARSNKEGIGRFLAPLLVGLAAQGIQSWKDNYDQRGVNKQRADVLNERISRGETLSAEEQAFYDKMKKNYPDRYTATASAFNGQNGAQPSATPAPQGGAQPAANGINDKAIPLAYYEELQSQLPNTQLATDTPFKLTEQPPTPQALGDYADRLRDATMSNLGRNSELDRLLQAGGKTRDDIMKDIAGLYWGR